MALQWGCPMGWSTQLIGQPVGHRGLERPPRKVTRMAQQQFRHGDDNRSAVRARDRARARVRRITAVIGVAATAAAVGLGVLVASDTTAHSSVAVRTPTTSTSTVPPPARRTQRTPERPSPRAPRAPPDRPDRPPHRRRRPRPRHRAGQLVHRGGDDIGSDVIDTGAGTAADPHARTATADPVDGRHRYHRLGRRHRSRRGRRRLGHDGRGPPSPRRGLQPVPTRLGAAAAGADRRGRPVA